VGHAGTLDPLAEGVLPLALGRATRLLDRLSNARKTYYAEATLGLRTSTDDAEGQVVQRAEVPEFTSAELQRALQAFLGEQDQTPPAYSALKVQGRRAYELARAGEDVSLSARRVTVFSIRLRGWKQPVLRFTVCCSKGTYIRALVRDLGDRLGCGAVLRRLVRSRVGPFALEEAVGLSDLERLRATALQPPDALLLQEPAVVLGQRELYNLVQGRTWSAAGNAQPVVRAYALDGRFAGMLAGVAGTWQPRLLMQG
jgi:tRNA pseudouridine55 synthase